MARIEEQGYREPQTPQLITKRQAPDYLQMRLPTINNELRRRLPRVYILSGDWLVRIKRADGLALFEEVAR